MTIVGYKFTQQLYDEERVHLKQNNLEVITLKRSIWFESLGWIIETIVEKIQKKFGFKQ